MSSVRYGVGLFPTAPAAEMVRLAVLAEELGFDTFWVADSHLIWRELYVLLGAIASKTGRIAIGPGVTHPVVRHPSITAAALATLEELAPGRVKLGLGVGDSGPANMGLGRARLEDLDRAARAIREMTAGGEMESAGTTLRLGYGSRRPVPIYIAAASDRTLRMSGTVADGAIVAGAVDELPDSIAAIREGERAAGRPEGSVEVVLWTTSCLDEDEQLARNAVRPVVARKAILTLGRLARTGRLDPVDREPLERLQRAYDTHHHMEPAYNDLVEERWIDRFAIAGTSAQILKRCRQAIADGADEIAMVFETAKMENQLRCFAAEVMAPLRHKA